MIPAQFEYVAPGTPSITLNNFGQGKAYYVASRNREPFFSDFLGKIIAESGDTRVINSELPAGVTAQLRTDGEHDYVFLLNFNAEERSVALDGAGHVDLLDQSNVEGTTTIAGYGVRVLKRGGRTHPLRSYITASMSHS